MTIKKQPELKPFNEKVAGENCCVEQVVNSIFDKVASNEPEELSNRSDHEEIIKLSHALVEGEFIFGSPDEEILESVNRRILSKSKNTKISQ